MESCKIGVITEPIIFWTGMTTEDSHEWGHVGMVVIMENVGNSHYSLSDPEEVLRPMFAIKSAVREIEIKWKRLR